MHPPKVLISYSHDSAEHSKAILELANQFRKDGIDVTIDQYEPDPIEGWLKWMEKRIEESDYVLIVFTEGYYKSSRQENISGVGKGVAWESQLIEVELYANNTNQRRFIPVVLRDDDREWIIKSMQHFTWYVLDNYSLDESSGYEKLYRILTNQPKHTRPKLGRLKQLAEREQISSMLNDYQHETKTPDNHSSSGVFDSPKPARLPNRIEFATVETLNQLVATESGRKEIEKFHLEIKTIEEKKLFVTTAIVCTVLNRENSYGEFYRRFLETNKDIVPKVIGNVMEQKEIAIDRDYPLLSKLFLGLGMDFESIANASLSSANTVLRKRCVKWISQAEVDDFMRAELLIGALEKEKDNSIVSEILDCLRSAKVIDTSQVLKYLDSTSEQVVQGALVLVSNGMGILPIPICRKIINIAISRKNEVVRQRATDLLVRITIDEFCVEDLEEGLLSNDNLRKIWSRQLIYKITEIKKGVSSSVVDRMLRSKLTEIKDLALTCILRDGHYGNYENIARLASDESDVVAKKSLKVLSLGKENAAKTWPILIDDFDRIRPKDHLVRLFGVFGVSNPEVVGALRGAFYSSNDHGVRGGALISLSRLDPDVEWVYKTLLEHINGNDLELLPKITIGLLELCRRDESFVDRLLAELNGAHCLFILKVFSEMGQHAEKIIPKVSPLLHSEDEYVLGETIDLIRSLGVCGQSVLDQLHLLLKVSKQRVLIKVIDALGVVGDQQSLTLLNSFVVKSRSKRGWWEKYLGRFMQKAVVEHDGLVLLAVVKSMTKLARKLS
jgi:hypothetical protein